MIKYITARSRRARKLRPEVLSLSLNAEGQNAKSLDLKDPPSEVFGGRRQISVSLVKIEAGQESGSRIMKGSPVSIINRRHFACFAKKRGEGRIDYGGLTFLKGSEGGGVFLNVERRRIFLTSREEKRKGRARQYEKQLGKGYFFLLFSRCNRGKNNVGISLSGTLLAFEKCVHRLKVLIAQEMSPSPTMPYSVLTVQTF